MSEKESNLFWSTYDQYLQLEEYLNEAQSNPETIDEIFDSLPELARELSGGDAVGDERDPFLPFAAAAKISFIMTYEDSPIDEIIQYGIIPHLVRFLRLQQATPLQLVAARALNGILRGSPAQAQAVLDNGGVTAFAGSLSSEDKDVKNEAILAVGCAASISFQFRRTLFEHGAFTQLVTLLEQHSQPAMLQKSLFLLKKSATALKNLCSGGPLPEVGQFEIALPTLRKLINLNPHGGVLGNICEEVCWTLSYASRGSADRIQAIINADLCPRLVLLLQIADNGIIHAILGIIGNFFKSTDPHVQVMIDNEIFPRLHQILEQYQATQSTVLKTACSIISGLIFGNRPRIQMVLDADLVQPLLGILHDQFEAEQVRWEAARTLSGIVRRGSLQQINNLVNQGCIGPLCRYLISADAGIQRSCIAGLWNILQKGREHEAVVGVNPFVELVRESGGFGRLHILRNDAHVGEMARRILTSFK